MFCFLTVCWGRVVGWCNSLVQPFDLISICLFINRFLMFVVIVIPYTGRIIPSTLWFQWTRRGSIRRGSMRLHRAPPRPAMSPPPPSPALPPQSLRPWRPRLLTTPPPPPPPPVTTTPPPALRTPLLVRPRQRRFHDLEINMSSAFLGAYSTFRAPFSFCPSFFDVIDSSFSF